MGKHGHHVSSHHVVSTHGHHQPTPVYYAPSAVQPQYQYPPNAAYYPQQPVPQYAVQPQVVTHHAPVSTHHGGVLHNVGHHLFGHH